MIDSLLAKGTELLYLDGFTPLNLEIFLPGVTDKPLLYLLVLDFCKYWCHCAQHGLGWLLGLYSLHHIQQEHELVERWS